MNSITDGKALRLDNILSETQQWLALRPTATSPSRDAWEQFYRRYDPFVRATISVFGVARTDFEDRVQDAWVELLRCLPDFRLDPSRGSLLAWMRTVVFRVTRDATRQGTRLALSPDSHGIVETVRDSKTPTPVAECEGREKRANIRMALRLFRRETSRLNYRVLYLISIKGLTVEEVGQRLNLTAPQVWTRHHRSKREFQRFIRSSDFF